jgi:hypothetical protein
MNVRSNQAEVRNPVLSLPSAQRIQNLSPESRAELAALLRDLSADARERAQKSWRQNKGPMAVYWKAVGAYATHLYRAIRPSAPSSTSDNPKGSGE